MDQSPSIGDIVRVGNGDTQWRVMDIGASGIVQLISLDSTMLRSELPWHLEPYA